MEARKGGGRAVSELGRYKKVYALDWLQARFQGLNDGERVTYLYLRTGPQTTSVGCFRVSDAVAVEELANVTLAEFQQRLLIVCSTFEWRYDATTRVLFIPEHLQQNPPQSPNVVTSWRKLLVNVPDCQVKADAIDAIHEQLKDLPEVFRKAFGSLADARGNSKAKPKAKPGAHQGSGTRDQGIRNQGSRSEAPNGDGKDERIARIARETVKSCRLIKEPTSLLGTFTSFYQSSYQVIDYTQDEALQAITFALEQRAVAGFNRF